MMNNIAKIENCTGCGACSVRCPKHCITMTEEDGGFLFPSVDAAECTGCGACLKTCPQVKPLTVSLPKAVYAARVKDKCILNSANSGGAFSAIALQVLSEGGMVCGAAWNSSLEVEHICITNSDDLAKLQGSKYVQSRSFDCFVTIKNALIEGRQVVFSGTACQIAGLRSYLIKDYDNLLTVELVCHGVPSPGLFRKYIEWLSLKAGGMITSYKFRSKQRRPTGEHSEFFYESNGKQVMGRSYEDPYYGSFLQGRTLRASCYNCSFKNQERVADITLGDFWGIERSHPEFPTKNGHSLVICNTDRGEDMFKKVMPMMEYVESSWEEACLRNHSLIRTASKPDSTYNLNSPTLFDKGLKVKLSFKNKVKNRLPWQVKWLLKKYL